MSKQQLTIEHLAPYLPYGLKYFIDFEDGDTAIYEMMGLFEDSGEVYLYGYETSVEAKNCKPILRPLSDLTKEIEHNGERFIPINELNDKTRFMGNQFKIYIDINGDTRLLYIGQPNRDFIRGLNPKEKLIEWHFDVFGLIDKNLAVNLNEVK